MVCHIDNTENPDASLPDSVFDATIEYSLNKLQQGCECDNSIYNLKIFYPTKKNIVVNDLINKMESVKKSLCLVYTIIPVICLNSNHTFLSICGVRNE